MKFLRNEEQECSQDPAKPKIAMEFFCSNFFSEQQKWSPKCQPEAALSTRGWSSVSTGTHFLPRNFTGDTNDG
jgi:hypothetical protein